MRVIHVAGRVVEIDDQRRRLAICKLVTGVVFGASPAVVSHGRRLRSCFAEARLVVHDMYDPGASVRRNRFYATGGRVCGERGSARCKQIC